MWNSYNGTFILNSNELCGFTCTLAYCIYWYHRFTIKRIFNQSKYCCRKIICCIRKDTLKVLVFIRAFTWWCCCVVVCLGAWLSRFLHRAFTRLRLFSLASCRDVFIRQQRHGDSHRVPSINLEKYCVSINTTENAPAHPAAVASLKQQKLFLLRSTCRWCICKNWHKISCFNLNVLLYG